MKLTTRACILCLVLSGCSTNEWRAPDTEATLQAVSNAQMTAADNSTGTTATTGVAPAAAGAPEQRYGYRLLDRSRTGLASVFDDGKDTYLRFETLAPGDLMLFDESGQRVAFDRYGAYVAIQGVHRGLLVRTYSARSYAVPAYPERVARVAASGEAESAPDAALPSQFAAARAWILEAQAQQRGLLLVPARSAGASAATPAQISVSELDSMEVRVGGRWQRSFACTSLQAARSWNSPRARRVPSQLPRCSRRAFNCAGAATPRAHRSSTRAWPGPARNRCAAC
jgi:hypothetical protein